MQEGWQRFYPAGFLKQLEEILRVKPELTDEKVNGQSAKYNLKVDGNNLGTYLVVTEGDKISKVKYTGTHPYGKKIELEFSTPSPMNRSPQRMDYWNKIVFPGFAV